MTELISCLSTGKGTWAHVAKLIKTEDWDKVYLITNEFGKQTFKPNEKTEIILINDREDINSIINSIRKQISSKITGPEVAFNMVSGTGKEHMAALSAILKMGLAVRLVYMKDDKLIEI